ncbi:MAG: hypothetical protein LUQ04_05470 [Methanoregula sp.]|nr:hypothetical protein [Methanoregula sp.]
MEYDYVGGVTEEDVDELIEFVNELREEVLQWLKKQHPDFLSGDSGSAAISK